MKIKLPLAAIVAALMMMVGVTAPAQAACPPGVTDPASCTPSAPTATTDPATDVKSGGATLRGTVVANGLATTFKFDFGTTTSYGQSTTTGSLSGNYTPQPVDGTITGLAPGTLYHYRVTATNSAGTAVGADRTFTTAANTPYGVPPTVVTGSAGAITQTTATISGTINPNGSNSAAAFQFGLTTAYGRNTTAANVGAGTTPVTTAGTLTGLAPGTTYHYRIVGVNGAGRSSGQDRTFTTLGASVPPVGRKRPGLSLGVRPRRDSSKPYRYTARGTLKRPAGVGRAAGCKGRVTVKLKRGRKTVASARTRIKRSTCRYAKRLTVKRRLARRGKLKVTARFGGNARLRPRSARSKTVRYGPR